MKINYTILLSIVVLFAYIKADLPIHCLVNTIIGDWTFSLSKTHFTPSLRKEETTCTHGFPGKIERNIGSNDKIPFEVDETFSLELTKDYKVKKSGSIVGTWTPVYDQSFIIYYENSILTASFQYYFEEKASTQFSFDCAKTMVGWIIRNKNNLHDDWSCLYGTKQGQSITGTVSFLQKESITMNTNSKSFIQLSTEKTNNLLQELNYEELEGMVNEINNSNLTWKAEVNPKFKGMKLIEMRTQLGLRNKNRLMSNTPHKKSLGVFGKHKLKPSLSMIQTGEKSLSYKAFLKQLNQEYPTSSSKDPNTKQSQEKVFKSTTSNNQREKDSNEVYDMNEMTKYIHTKPEDIDENKIAKNWDWRNVGGIDYVGEAEAQNSCGSCYAFSTIRALQSRLRILTHNEDQTEFSVQFPISCNFYSEGCAGGYPILTAKFLSEFEIIPKSCFRYTASDNHCGNACDYTKNPKKYVVSEYGYLGGYYGATSEALMMKEIRARGPIPGNIKVPLSFNYYKDGIYSASNLHTNAETISKMRMVDNHIYYEKVEHSITLVGYGEEDGIKYWIGMNTWGNDWGEKGFFKVLRGENEINIETMGDYFNVKVLDR